MTKLPLTVSETRWQQAQQWELATWRDQHALYHTSRRARLSRLLRLLTMRRPPPVEMDDWNHWWREKFDGYRFLPEEIENAIELGCGPFTNMRLILQGRQIKHVFCSDPLARRYAALKGTWLSRAWRKADVLIDDHPIEKCPFASDYFGLVVLVNVLDHVQDAALCLRQAIRITAPEGYLVIGQDLSDEEDLRATAEDVGHPVKIPQEALDAELGPWFDPVLFRILPREHSRNPKFRCGTYLFAGRKRGATST
jgi:SAM-dependent methyltransferase